MICRNLLTCLIIIVMSPLALASSTEKTASIPFWNFLIKPRENLYVNYELSEHNPSLRCILEPYVNFNVDWQYKGEARHSTLDYHEITLSYKKGVKGNRTGLADQKGTLVLTPLFIWGPTSDNTAFAKCVYNVG